MTRDLTLTPYQQGIADYWNAEANPVNLRLGEVDGLFHHHYGIGPVSPDLADVGPGEREQEVIAELHRLETAQASLLLDHLGPLTPDDRVLDGGSGRGGTSIMTARRFGCRVDGVSISSKQVRFATEQAHALEVADRVAFHLQDMTATGFDTGAYQAVWTNETDMYVDLDPLCGEFARLLAPGGRYVTITGVADDLQGPKSPAVKAIDEHYGCRVHTRTGYLRALLDHGFTPAAVLDLTDATLPYWELRARTTLTTGIEQAFISGYRDRTFRYLLIAADRRPDASTS